MEQPLYGMQNQEDGRAGDESGLAKTGQQFGFAVAKTVFFVRRQQGIADRLTREAARSSRESISDARMLTELVRSQAPNLPPISTAAVMTDARVASRNRRADSAVKSISWPLPPLPRAYRSDSPGQNRR